jgi:hypothetical protein
MNAVKISDPPMAKEHQKKQERRLFAVLISNAEITAIHVEPN